MYKLLCMSAKRGGRAEQPCIVEIGHVTLACLRGQRSLVLSPQMHDLSTTGQHFLSGVMEDGVAAKTTG